MTMAAASISANFPTAGCDVTRPDKRCTMRASCVASLLIALATATYAQVPSPKSAVEAEVLAALAERDKAFLAGDEDAVARFMVDDYLQTDAAGHVQDKATWLKEYFEPIAAKIKSGEWHWEVFRKTDLRCANSAM